LPVLEVLGVLFVLAVLAPRPSLDKSGGPP
jgi:hypothetical protein